MSILKFLSSHSTGLISAALLAVAGVVVDNVYEALLAQGQAYAAANQVEDSMASWMLHQQASYGDVIPNLIIAGTVILVTLCLLPTVRHLIRLSVNKD